MPLDLEIVGNWDVSAVVRSKIAGFEQGLRKMFLSHHDEEVVSAFIPEPRRSLEPDGISVPISLKEKVGKNAEEKKEERRIFLLTQKESQKKVTHAKQMAQQVQAQILSGGSASYTGGVAPPPGSGIITNIMSPTGTQ